MFIFAGPLSCYPWIQQRRVWRLQHSLWNYSTEKRRELFISRDLFSELYTMEDLERYARCGQAMPETPSKGLTAWLILKHGRWIHVVRSDKGSVTDQKLEENKGYGNLFCFCSQWFCKNTLSHAFLTWWVSHFAAELLVSKPTCHAITKSLMECFVKISLQRVVQVW